MIFNLFHLRTKIKLSSEELYISKNYFNPINNDLVGQISYSVSTGQIGLIRILPKYQKLGFGKSLILDSINDNDNEYSLPENFWFISSRDHPIFSKKYKSRPNRFSPNDSVLVEYYSTKTEIKELLYSNESFFKFLKRLINKIKN